MKPVNFIGVNKFLESNDPEEADLPVRTYGTGVVTHCWELSDEEIALIAKTKRLWISQAKGEADLQGIAPTAAAPFVIPILDN